MILFDANTTNYNSTDFLQAIYNYKYKNEFFLSERVRDGKWIFEKNISSFMSNVRIHYCDVINGVAHKPILICFDSDSEASILGFDCLSVRNGCWRGRTPASKLHPVSTSRPATPRRPVQLNQVGRRWAAVVVVIVVKAAAKRRITGRGRRGQRSES